MKSLFPFQLFLAIIWILTLDQVLAISDTNGTTLFFPKPDPIIAIVCTIIAFSATAIYYLTTVNRKFKRFYQLECTILKAANLAYKGNYEANLSVSLKEINNVDLSTNIINFVGVNMRGERSIITLAIRRHSSNWCRLQYFTDHDRSESPDLEINDIVLYNDLSKSDTFQNIVKPDYEVMGKYLL